MGFRTQLIYFLDYYNLVRKHTTTNEAPKIDLNNFNDSSVRERIEIATEK